MGKILAKGGAALAALAVVVALVLSVGGNGDADEGNDPVTSVAVADQTRVVETGAESVCAPGTEVKFFAYETTDASFGPAVDPNTETVLQELHNRRCADPALVVAHEMYQTGDFLTEAGRDERIAHLASNRTAHDEAVAALELHEAEAASVTIEHINVENQSMWMLDTQPRPTIAAGPSNVPDFDALVFTYADGKREVYKLDCGFQPMSPSFPELPPIPPELVPPPPTTQPGQTTVPQVTTTTVPPTSTHPPGTNPPPTTTTPTVTTPPPTTRPPVTTPPTTVPRTHPPGTPAPEATQPPYQPPATTATTVFMPPPGPAPQEGQMPPPPNDGGYDSGEEDGSGTPNGGSCQVDPETEECIDGTVEGGGPDPDTDEDDPVVDDGTHSGMPAPPS